ncbi:hypothetical protein GGTG_07619 [Gaeumannomyces tritici R3-111a-1]|uniref:Rhodopsin domain-containing protein n=1 Tax=Gaeumannomyces tritici (strain R3-111a-1) TaxID=644352 RepID=J3P271_GAET3|nr:hypothetical protein GGTG_07619 [Gaeumannomyces tritici R3-111a-1]EJT73763.1 hypothetical protein GGTG_07619 [Gaeumannomyces tritici R3-111a-1]
MFVCNISVNLILFIQPIPYIWRLQQMSAAKKAGVILMLSLGLFICMISVIRILQAVRTNSTGISYQLVEPIIWSNAEISAIISCACIPTLKQAGSHVRRLASPPRSSGRSAPERPRQGQPRTPENTQRPDLLTSGGDTLFSWRFKILALSSKQTSDVVVSMATTAAVAAPPQRLGPMGNAGALRRHKSHLVRRMMHDDGQHGKVSGGVPESERAATSTPTAVPAEALSIVARGSRSRLLTRIMVAREVNLDVASAWPRDMTNLQRAIAEAWFPHLPHNEDAEAGSTRMFPESQPCGRRRRE